MIRFKDRIAVVIGGNSGIGLASAIAFAEEGATVVISGREEQTLRAAAKQIGPATLAVQSDVAEVHGRIDVLFVNAGVGAFVPIEQVTEEDWDRIVSINLKGPYFTIQKALTLMGFGGAIVLNSSIGRSKGLPGNSVYAATKAGLRARLHGTWRRTRWARDPSEFHQPGPDRNTDRQPHTGAGCCRRSSDASNDARSRSDETARPPRRGCEDGAVLGLGRCVVHHRDRRLC